MIAYRMYQSRVQRIWLIRIVIIDSARCGGGWRKEGDDGEEEEKKCIQTSFSHISTYV